MTQASAERSSNAYARLEMYLESVKIYFQSYQDSADIVADIENRIAEQCAQRSSASRLVTLSDVEHVIGTMGSVDQFDNSVSPEHWQGERTAATGARAFGSGQRRLFRDPGDMVIAGVASGIARYCDVAPHWVRLFFLTPLIIGAAAVSLHITIIGVVIYLLFWLFVPLTKTTTDRLRMRGDPITLASVERRVRDAETAAAPSARTPAVAAMMVIGSTIRMVVLSTAWAVGFSTVAGTVVVAIGLTAFLAMVLSNPHMLPMTDELSSPARLGLAYYPFMVCSYLLMVIPLVLVSMTVVTEFRRRRDSRWSRPAFRIYMAALSVWLVALVVWAWLWASSPFCWH